MIGLGDNRQQVAPGERMPDLGLEAKGTSRDSAPLLAAPDYGPPGNAPVGELLTEVDDIALARADEYRLLAALLAKPPSPELLARIARIPGDGTKLGRAHAALAQAARDA